MNLAYLFLLVGFILIIALNFSIYRNYKYFFIIGIIFIAIGCILLVIKNSNSERYQQLASGTVWTNSENDNSGLGWVL